MSSSDAGLSLYDRLGGAATVRAATAVFYRRVLGDPAVARHFAGVDAARLEAHQRWFLTSVLGGPDAFTGRHLAQAHAGLDLTDADFDVVVEHLLSAFDDLGVPGADVVEIGAAVQDLRPLVVAPVAPHPLPRIAR